MRPTRRQFLESAGAGVLSLYLQSCGRLPPDTETGGNGRPNILLICVDDLRPELGCYDKEYMKTPHLDRLAGEAVTFSRHHIQAPSCGPSRLSLLTGFRPRSQDELSNDFMERNFHERPEAEWPETFVHHFRRNGYHTVGIGKVSHTPDGLVRDGGGAWELPYSWDEMLCDTGKWGGGFDAFFAYADGESRASMDFQVPPFESGDVPDEGYPDGLNARLAVEKLHQLSGTDEPFLLSVGFFKPHLPFNSPQKYWDLYERDEIPLSPNPDLPESTSRDLLHPSGEFFNNYRRGKEQGGIGVKVSDEYAREIRHAYFAAVSYVDAQIGKVLTALRDLGLDRNTIVVVWGDHGWHLGDHTLWGKHSPFERSSNSPLIVRIPGMENAGSRTNALVETIDLYPTLCELAGIGLPREVDGTSLVDLVSDPGAPGKPAVYTYWRNVISMRTDRYRLIARFEEGSWTFTLFDHQVDPNEARNVADENPAIVRELLPLLQEGNNGILPDVLVIP